MRGDTFAKLALGCAGIFAIGGATGVGLANYTSSGAFDFYRQHSASAWQPAVPPQPEAMQSADPAFAAGYRYDPEQPGARQALASLNP